MGRWLVNLGVLATASGKVYFSETFGSGWESRWTSSEWKKSDGTQGTWKLSTGKWYNDESEDQGIQTAEDSRFFGLSAGFDSFSNAGKELIIQYQAKYEKDIECGGGYVKVRGWGDRLSLRWVPRSDPWYPKSLLLIDWPFVGGN